MYGHAVMFPMQAHDALIVDLELTPTATAWRATALQRGALLAWRDHTAAAAQQRLQEAAHQRTWSRVRGWLTELEGDSTGGTGTDEAAALAGGLEHSSSSIRAGLAAGLGAGEPTGAQGSLEGSYQLGELAADVTAGGSDWAMGAASGVACSDGGSCGGDWEAPGRQRSSAGGGVGGQRSGGQHGDCKAECLGVGVGAVEVDVSMWDVDAPESSDFQCEPTGPGPDAGDLEDGEGQAGHRHGGGEEWLGGWASGGALHRVSEGVGGEGSVGDLAALAGWFEAAGRAIDTLSTCSQDD